MPPKFRTPQTAKKSTGIKAQRKCICPSEEAGDSAPKRPRTDHSRPSTHTKTLERILPSEEAADSAPERSRTDRSVPPARNFCSLCQDGGTLFACNNCPRVVCAICVEVPEEHRVVILGDDVQFTCVSCHFKLGRAAGPYFGFTVSGQPALPSFLKVKGRFEMGTIGQILCPATLLLDIHFVEVSIKAHVAMIYAALQDFFPTGGFRLISIPFSLGTDDAVADWPTVVGHHLKTLTSSYRVVVVVTNHTDEDTGDMFFGVDETGKGHAAEVDQFFDVLWAPFRELLDGAIVYFASCGSLVTHRDSLTKLKASVEGRVEYVGCYAYRQWGSFKAQHALAFDAPRLQATSTAVLLAQLTKRNVLHGIDFTKALEDVLPDMSELGRHSSIIHFVGGNVFRYVWAHKTYQPWGQRISMQCDQCGVLQEWTGARLEDGLYSFECTYTGCGYKGKDRAKDAFSFVVPRPNCEVIHSKRQTPTAWLKEVYM